MTTTEQKIAGVTGLVAYGVSWLVDGIGIAATALLAFMALDYVTGLLAAAKNRKLNSRIGMNGFIRKVYVLLLISSVYLLEFVASSHFGLQILDNGHIGDGLAFAYIAIEFISITENGKKMNAPMPIYLKNIVDIVKEKTGLEANKESDNQ